MKKKMGNFLLIPKSYMVHFRIINSVLLQGMTWRELRELFSGGFKSYWTDVFNYSDVFQLVLYWLALVFQTLSYVNVSLYTLVLVLRRKKKHFLMHARFFFKYRLRVG